ncbi:glucosamine kinase [Rheinheimera pacifica]|uniref:BadF/BadG/BcrA/BcrD ATPase family protein n=1 Tax=Rheinheimera pacifica TaxID=173990 RepID=UPI002858E8A6|nr:BadF/BadG/BcrA/BcrD ATPase family protein [Rheinheimera pacifica]MDR6984628.1 glucosamine kinase [Rheinheimera pacifica]
MTSVVQSEEILVQQSEPLFIGVDGGGSKCKARLENANGQLLAEALAGPANPATDFAQTTDSILSACQRVLQLAGYASAMLAQSNVVLGLAGVNVPRVQQRMQDWQHPFAALQVTTDLHIACLGAHAGQDGAILITGTGTAAFATVNAKQWLFSAQGFPLGDRGSGAWLGWQGVCATLDVLDGLQPATELTRSICRRLGVSSNTDLISCCMGYKAVDYGQLAPLVLQQQQQGDPYACDITARGLGYIQALLQRLQHTGATRIAMIGGLAPQLAALLPAALQQQLSPVQGSPEVGAAALARQYFLEKVI